MLRGYRDVSDKAPALEEHLGRSVLGERANKPAVIAQGDRGWRAAQEAVGACPSALSSASCSPLSRSY